MNRYRIQLAVLTAMSVVMVAGTAMATTFNIAPGGLSQAMFNSSAPLESITGTSNVVTGQVELDLDNLSGARATVSIDASSFRTGIEDRDEHLRSENWIDAAQYPEIRFELTSVDVPEGTGLEAAMPVQAQLTGNIEFHGVTHEITAAAEVTYYVLDEATREAGRMTGLVNNALRIETSFELSLSDYNISIPPVLDLKMSNVITITMRLTGIEQDSDSPS